MTLTASLILAFLNISLAWNHIRREHADERFRKFDIVLGYMLIIGGSMALGQALNELFKFNF